MPALKITREEAIERIADVFRLYGYDGASLRRFSSATGLGRASLYHHFPGGKEEMALEVFGSLGATVARDILTPLSAPGTAGQRIDGWLRGLERFYAKGEKNCLLGAMVLCGGSTRFSKELGAAFGLWISTLSRALEEAGFDRRDAKRRAENAVATVQGSLIVSRGLGDAKVFRRALKDLRREILAT